jgi:hypothetical protein
MDNQYKGMTVNERLYVSGLMEKFDLAVEKKNIEKVVAILKKVEITDESAIKPILKEIGLIEKF